MDILYKNPVRIIKQHRPKNWFIATNHRLLHAI